MANVRDLSKALPTDMTEDGALARRALVQANFPRISARARRNGALVKGHAYWPTTVDQFLAFGLALTRVPHSDPTSLPISGHRAWAVLTHRCEDLHTLDDFFGGPGWDEKYVGSMWMYMMFEVKVALVEVTTCSYDEPPLGAAVGSMGQILDASRVYAVRVSFEVAQRTRTKWNTFRVMPEPASASTKRPKRKYEHQKLKPHSCAANCGRAWRCDLVDEMSWVDCESCDEFTVCPWHGKDGQKLMAEHERICRAMDEQRVIHKSVPSADGGALGRGQRKRVAHVVD